MKNQLLLTLILCLYAMGSVPLSAQSDDLEILGVYKYMLENQRGMAIISPHHFIWVVTPKNRAMHTDGLTIEEKAKEFDELNAGAGTWESLGNKRYRVTYSHHSNANLIGQSFEWEYEAFDGDVLKYWVLKPDGTRRPEAQTRKISNWGDSGSCAKYNGSWIYEGANGFYMQSGNYGAWIIQNELVTDHSTNARKAQAFDSVNSSFAIGDCSKEGGKDLWHLIHSSSPIWEFEVTGSQISNQEGDVYHWNVLNSRGELSDGRFATKRIEK